MVSFSVSLFASCCLGFCVLLLPLLEGLRVGWEQRDVQYYKSSNPMLVLL